MNFLSRDTDSTFFNFRTRVPSDVLPKLNGTRALIAFDSYRKNPGFVASRSCRLAEAGYASRSGQPYSATAGARILGEL